MRKRTIIVCTGLVTLIMFLPHLAPWKQNAGDLPGAPTTTTTEPRQQANQEKLPSTPPPPQAEQPQKDSQTPENKQTNRPRLTPAANRSLDTPRPESPQQAESRQSNHSQPQVPNSSVFSEDELKMINLVNAYRVKSGLAPLTASTDLTKAARLKAADMIKLNYFSHTSPTYGSPFNLMKQLGIEYGYAGENLAGASTVDIAHSNLVKSPGHRENMTSKNYRKIGVGIVSGGPYGKMFVQLFTD